jgi:hypothetical protein
MRKQHTSVAFLMVLAACLSVSAAAHAAVISVANCTQAIVQAAINSAATGDVVSVPAGSATWTTGVNIPNSKKITLLGAGQSSTLISGSGSTVVKMNQSGGRLTGFGFTNGVIAVDGHGWRIDHNTFTNSGMGTFFTAISAVGNVVNDYPTGLVDHNNFIGARIIVCGSIYSMAENGTQNWIWAQPLGIGGPNAVFVEDNNFDGSSSYTNAFDGNYAGRLVFRYNTVKDMYFEMHSVQGTNRAFMLWEVYNNTVAQVSQGEYMPFRTRGGTGVIFNNTFTGTWWNGLHSGAIALDLVRENPAEYGPPAFSHPPGWAYGVTLNTLAFSASAKNITTSSGSFAIGVDGTSTIGFNVGDVIQVTGSASNNGQYTITAVTATTITVAETLQDEAAGATVHINMPWDGAANGYPARDQIGRGSDAGQAPNGVYGKGTWYPQALEPAYEWNNLMNGSPMHFMVINGSSIGICLQAGRDFYNATQRPGYAPYTYPHPLIQIWNSSSAQAPVAPKNLRIK